MAYDGRGRVPSGFGSAPRRSRSNSLSGGFGLNLDYAPAYGARSVTGCTADDLASRSLPRPRLPGFSGAYSGFANQTLGTSLDDIELPFGGSGLSRSRSRCRYSSSARRSDDGAARSRSVASVESRRPRHSDAASGLEYGPARAPSRPYYPPSASKSGLSPSLSPHPAPDYEDRRRGRRQSTTSQWSEPAMFSFEHDEEAGAGPSRPRRPTVSSSGSWEPTRPNLGRDEDKPSSRLWGPASSSSNPPEHVTTLGRRPLLSSTHASRSSRKGIAFERSSGEGELHSSPEGRDVQFRGRAPRSARHAQIYPTSFKSGFTDDMVIDENGEECFKPGGPLHTAYSAYRSWGGDYRDAKSDGHAHYSDLFRAKDKKALSPLSSWGSPNRPPRPRP